MQVVCNVLTSIQSLFLSLDQADKEHKGKVISSFAGNETEVQECQMLLGMCAREVAQMQLFSSLPPAPPPARPPAPQKGMRNVETQAAWDAHCEIPLVQQPSASEALVRSDRAQEPHSSCVKTTSTPSSHEHSDDPLGPPRAPSLLATHVSEHAARVTGHQAPCSDTATRKRTRAAMKSFQLSAAGAHHEDARHVPNMDARDVQPPASPPAMQTRTEGSTTAVHSSADLPWPVPAPPVATAPPVAASSQEPVPMHPCPPPAENPAAPPSPLGAVQPVPAVFIDVTSAVVEVELGVKLALSDDFRLCFRNDAVGAHCCTSNSQALHTAGQPSL